MSNRVVVMVMLLFYEWYESLLTARLLNLERHLRF